MNRIARRIAVLEERAEKAEAEARKLRDRVEKLERAKPERTTPVTRWPTE
jgi:hypothetical protein